MGYWVTNSPKRIFFFLSTMLTIPEKRAPYAFPVNHHDGRERLSFTVQPKAGRWMKQAYFAK